MADIVRKPITSLNWEPGQTSASLQALHDSVIANAEQAAAWYFRSKQVKKRASWLLRFGAIVLVSGAGLVPVLAAAGVKGTIPLFGQTIDSGQLGYLFAAVAAALLGFDRFLGISTGWIRYVTTGLAIHRQIDDFRLQWQILMIQATLPPPDPAPPPPPPAVVTAAPPPAVVGQLPPPPDPAPPPPADAAPPAGDPPPAIVTPADARTMLTALKTFAGAVGKLVADETNAWVTEFQNNMAQLNKAVADVAAAQAPGIIDVKVDGSDQADAPYQVSRDGMSVGSGQGPDFPIAHVPPGYHSVTVTATVKGKPVTANAVVTVPAGGLVTASVKIA